ncbi:hypothetical protein P9112_008675 [Eukaryota sp. TZLM1-RC]
MSSGPWKRQVSTVTSPSERFGHVSIPISEYLLVFGGISRRSSYRQDTYIFDTTAGQWSMVDKHSSIPEPRYRSAGASCGMVAFIFGGLSSKMQELNDMWSFDLTKQVWTPITPTNRGPSPRYGHSMVSLGSKLYVFGGVKQRRPTHFYNDLWVFDTVSHEWSLLSGDSSSSSLPEGRYGHIMDYVPAIEAFFLFGGTAKEGKRLNDGWVFSPLSNSFHKYAFATNFPAPPSLTHSSAATISNDALLVMGGQSSRGPCISTFVLLFQPKLPVIKCECIDGDWNDHTLFQAPCERFLHTLDVTMLCRSNETEEEPRFLCLFGGTPDGTTANDELWIIELNPFCHQLGLIEQVPNSPLADSQELDFSENNVETSQTTQNEPSSPLADVLAGYFRSHCSIRDVALVLGREIDHKVDQKIGRIAEEHSKREAEESAILAVIKEVSEEVEMVKKSLDLTRSRLNHNQEELAQRVKNEKNLTVRVDSVESSSTEIHTELYKLLSQIQDGIKENESKNEQSHQELLNNCKEQINSSIEHLVSSIQSLDTSFSDSLNRRAKLMEDAIKNGDEAAKEEIKEVFDRVSFLESKVDEGLEGVKKETDDVMKVADERLIKVDCELSGLGNKVNANAEAMGSLESELNERIDHLSDGNSKNSTLINEMQKEMAKMKEEFEKRLENQVQEVKDSLEAKFTEENRRLLSQIDEKIEENNRLRVELSESINQELSLVKKTFDYTESIEALYSEISKIKNSITALTNDDSFNEVNKISTSNLVDKIRSVRNELFTESQQLQTRVEQVEHVLESMKGEFKSSVGSIGSVESELRESIENIEDDLTRIKVGVVSLGLDLE